MTDSSFTKLAAINVNEHVEKKGSLSYLSWPWAVDQLLRFDPEAKWEYGEPRMFGETMMLYCTVTVMGQARTMQLPVMDHKNKAIAHPDAFQVNTAMQRCLVKAIALHGLGLYIYAGEDLPLGEQPAEDPPPARLAERVIADLKSSLNEAATLEDLRARTQKALTMAHQCGDTEAHMDLKNYATAIAEGLKKAA